MVTLKAYLISNKELLKSEGYYCSSVKDSKFDVLVDVFLNQEFFENNQDHLDLEEEVENNQVPSNERDDE